MAQEKIKLYYVSVIIEKGNKTTVQPTNAYDNKMYAIKELKEMVEKAYKGLENTHNEEIKDLSKFYSGDEYGNICYHTNLGWVNHFYRVKEMYYVKIPDFNE